MCVFRAPKMPDPTPMATPIVVAARQNTKQSNEMPSSKDKVDPDEISGVEYGSQTRKNPTEAEGKKGTGAKALKIPLNTATGAGTGAGLNA